MAYHMAYQIILYMDSIFMWSETQGCISFPHIHISITIPHKGNKGFIMWYKYYCQRIALKYLHFPFPIHRGYLLFRSQTPLFWIRLFIKGPHTEFSLPRSTGLIWVPKPFSPLWLCYWSTDPHCFASSICHFTPTVLWQAWPGQIAEQNMVSRNHKERKMRIS